MLGESCHTSSAVGSIFVASSRTRLAPVARPVPGKMRPTVTITPQAIPKAFSFGVPIRSRSHGSTPSCVTSPPNCCRSARPRSIRTAWFSSLSLPAVWWAASTDRIEMGWLWSDPAGPSKINSLGPTHENQGWWCPETAGHSPTTPLAPVIEACHWGWSAVALRSRTAGLPQCAIRYILGSGRYTDRAVRQIAAFFDQISSAGHNSVVGLGVWGRTCQRIRYT